MMRLLPLPQSITTSPGTWRLSERTALTAEPGLEPVADLLRELTGQPLDGPGPDAILLALDPSLTGERYRISVGAHGVTVTAGGLQGHRMAVQTLRQLLPASPYTEIEDGPRFAWRGVMLDVGRHFMPVAFVRKMIDLAAMNRLNVLHLHLTDDQGWRMEIERYPRLTEVGAWRAESMLGHYRDQRFDGIPHGGFYTKAELRDLVAHAERRGVTIVPEIDLPGHMRAAIAAYPELGNDPGHASPVATTWGVHDQVLNVEESTIAFCHGVLEEVLEVFPSPYIHIGGDECPKKEWRESPRVQERMRELGLADEEALQSWFVGRMVAFLAERGRKPVGWDEILQGGLAPGATVMSWQGEQGGIEAAAQGHDAVMCPHDRVYLDHYQADPEHEPLAIGGLLTLEHVYAYEPVPDGVDPARVLGTQANLWTEYMPTPGSVEYMAFPRLCALAEVAWGTSGDFAGFRARLEPHLAWLGVGHRPL
ncbi:beta-N-acetylhexosaminidase [Nonomuraea sp. NBC_01738]|uniref:beta-N-acetylhexosaminidase n=1 Tax=Nonomuraea sp. NBC_01738 TaxID=2976003 RepID=UPI002E157F9C|nr:beta-N-acetylhexosaminidase [Nonomuraea sp. NBC_01738]